ncbi:MAG: beta-phosphoglucomutase family hydrolase [Actinomycetota bacterium]|nr:beta-phosphoglucomutase family hydrolase [Actinomycetota bacterium]
MSQDTVVIPPDRFDAVIFDMDGVVTDTASLHSKAWRQMFDDYLRRRAAERGETFQPFRDEDYRRYVDGKPRFDGVASFLASRGVDLPFGRPDDPPGRETVCGLGNRKNNLFSQFLDEHGPRRYESTVQLLHSLREHGIRPAVISSSRNAPAVLEAAGVRDLFDAEVGGQVAAELGLPGKPDPAVFLEAARRLNTAPSRAVVVEDAIAGVQAGRAGGFGLVIGVDRAGHPHELVAAGADVVVDDLESVCVADINDVR